MSGTKKHRGVCPTCGGDSGAFAQPRLGAIGPTGPSDPVEREVWLSRLPVQDPIPTGPLQFHHDIRDCVRSLAGRLHTAEKRLT